MKIFSLKIVKYPSKVLYFNYPRRIVHVQFAIIYNMSLLREMCIQIVCMVDVKQV